mgnify:CR=1 FL=1
MKYLKHLNLYYSLIMVTFLSSCLANECRVTTDYTVSKRIVSATREQLFAPEAAPVSFEYQLLTDEEKENQLLLYLKDSVSTMTISSYDPVKGSKLMMREESLDKGFYNFPLPKATASNLQYWEVKLGSQRALVFIK